MLAELEIALWDLLSPIAKQCVNEGADTHLRDKEAYYVWNILHHKYPAIAARCVHAARADAECFQKFRECKDRIITEFASLCIADLRSTFIKPLMGSLGMLDK